MNVSKLIELKERVFEDVRADEKEFYKNCRTKYQRSLVKWISERIEDVAERLVKSSNPIVISDLQDELLKKPSRERTVDGVTYSCEKRGERYCVVARIGSESISSGLPIDVYEDLIEECCKRVLKSIEIKLRTQGYAQFSSSENLELIKDILDLMKIEYTIKRTSYEEYVKVVLQSCEDEIK